MKQDNIHPIFDRVLSQSDQERLLNQKATVLWFTGLSGSGKSTIAETVEKELYKKGYLVKLLDGDNIRSGINSNLSFTIDDRLENIRRIAEITKLFLECGVIVLCSFVSPTKKIRSIAQSIIGESNFKEIYVDASLAECEKRDVKGLYALAREGKIKGFTGIDSPYEVPEQPSLTIQTEKLSAEDSSKMVLDLFLKHN